MTARARLYDARGVDRDVPIAEIRASKADDRTLLWIDVDDRGDDQINEVAKALELEPTIVRQLGRERRRPRIIRQPDRIAMTLIAVEEDDTGALVLRDLDLVAGRNLIVTVHDGPLAAVEEFQQQLSGERELGLLDAGAFLTGLIDSVLAGYLREVEAVEREIDKLDEIALRMDRGDDDFLSMVVTLRHRIALLRRSLAPNREAVTPLVRPDFEVAKGDIVRPWPGLVDRLEQTISAVENARELLVGSFDIYLGRAAHRSNAVMKTLTIISAIALPAVVLAGVMGMNFHLEFFDTPENFYIVLMLMALFASAILLIARWRHWV